MVADLDEPLEPRTAEDRAIRLERVRDAPCRQSTTTPPMRNASSDGQQRRRRARPPSAGASSARRAFSASALPGCSGSWRTLGSGRLLPSAGRPASRARAPPRSPSGGNSATISPSYMTRIRSESDRISSSSRETSRTARPSSRSSMSRRWTNSIAPTSRPRVGCAAMSTFGSRSTSRASDTFCWLPPESALGLRLRGASSDVELLRSAAAPARRARSGRASRSASPAACGSRAARCSPRA